MVLTPKLALALWMLFWLGGSRSFAAALAMASLDGALMLIPIVLLIVQVIPTTRAERLLARFGSFTGESLLTVENADVSPSS